MAKWKFPPRGHEARDHIPVDQLRAIRPGSYEACTMFPVLRDAIWDLRFQGGGTRAVVTAAGDFMVIRVGSRGGWRRLWKFYRAPSRDLTTA